MPSEGADYVFPLIDAEYVPKLQQLALEIINEILSSTDPADATARRSLRGISPAGPASQNAPC